MIGDGEDEIRFDWRRGGAAAAGLAAALVLVLMVFMVKFANDAREKALDAERHSYDVSLVVRNASSNISRGSPMVRTSPKASTHFSGSASRRSE